ncbi:MAG: hypothetical protein IPI81_05850 [Flavobacteriales bacterium]|nr:hypothetical protein [Flavobacteriales bacterium]MCC6938649.1 hypothetical protein [Flavobacteriales bacterium]
MIVGGVLVTAAATTYGVREYNRVPETAAERTEVASLTAIELLEEFLANEQAATTKYVGSKAQAVLVTGAIRAVDEVNGRVVTVVLETGNPDAGVSCEFALADFPADWRTGATVRLKGICQGYTGVGMIPGDVVLQRCVAME